MILRKKVLMAFAAICAVTLLLAPLAAAHYPNPHRPTAVTVAAGETWVVNETTRLHKLTIEEGALVTAPEGYSLTMTVNGVETGGVLEETAGVDTILAAGTYRGDIMLTVAEANPVDYNVFGPPGTDPVVLTFPFRQALYLDDTGLVEEKSVPAAVFGPIPLHNKIRNIFIRSTGENFNGIYVTGGSYDARNIRIDFSGNGRSDFIGFGAAVAATGTDTRLVVDHARIETKGVVRTGMLADNGSNLIVKHSYIQVNNGVLPEDYVPTVDTTQMRSVPWMLSLSGNCRATNLLGTDTKASYIDSFIGAEGWGVLSTDGCTTPQLTAINSTIAITGEDGYGSYGIGDATERFLGCTIDVATYATISRGSFLYYGDSDPELVAQLNDDLELGLSNRELRHLRPQPTIVNSQRFGIMWHGGGTLDISGGTIFNTGETTFLDKGQAIKITVDGSQGAQLNPGNGVLLQVMDDDDPGPVPPAMTNTGVYYEPTGPVTPQAGRDTTVAGSEDALATFANIVLNGNFYNSMRGDIPGGMGPAPPRNLGLTFDNASITGVISASTAHHVQSTITADDYRLLGEVTNTPSEAVNNGVIVSLTNGSVWTVTGTCHLTSLLVEEGSLITAADGQDITMTVDGTPTEIAAGVTYTGAIVLTVD